jgi:hypothetical protein
MTDSNESQNEPRLKTLRELVEDGTILDFKDIGDKHKLLAHLFITKELWNDKTFTCKFKFYLGFIVGYLGYAIDYDKFGIHKNTACDYLLEPNEEYGLVVVLAHKNTAANLNLIRTSGETVQCVM